MKNSNLKLGIFFTGGLLILIVGLYLIGARQNLFERSIKVTTQFSDAMGLQEGSSVRYIGITIGSVEKITILNDTCVNVSMNINKDEARFVTRDAIAVINSDGLMGNKLVTILPGTDVAKSVENGDQLKSREPIGMENVMNSVLENSRNLEQLTTNLIDMTAKISSGQGMVGRLLFDSATDREFVEMIQHVTQSVNNLKSTTADINEITEKIKGGEGTIGKLVYDSSIANSIDGILDSIAFASKSLNHASKEISIFSSKLNNGHGPISKLVSDSSMTADLEETIANARDRSAELEETIEIVNESWILNLFSGRKKKQEQETDF